MLEFNRIYNMDCLEGMKLIDDNSIDLIVTDPPYDVDVDHDGGRLYANKNFTKSNEDLVGLGIDKGYDIVGFGKEIVRIQPFVNAYFFCNKKQIPEYFDFYVRSLGCKFELLTWHKGNALPTYNGKYLTDTEYCLYFFEGGHKLCNPMNYDDAKTFFVNPINSKDKKLYGHPTIKPLPFVEKLVRNSSKEGGVVLDPFIGSGTTAVACINMKRNFTGFEINKEYFGIAEKRINESLESSKQTLLF